MKTFSFLSRITVTAGILTFSSLSAHAANLADTIKADPNLSTLSGLIEKAGLTDSLKSGQHTVFAPTNSAFSQLTTDEMNALNSNNDLLKQTLSYHVVETSKTSSQLTTDTLQGHNTMKSLEGSNINTSVVPPAPGSLLINNAAGITTPDVTADNGIIQEINHVLKPGLSGAAPSVYGPFTPVPIFQHP